MSSSELAPLTVGSTPAERTPRRGAGRGSSFFAIRRETWSRLWVSPASNRLSFVTTYLVLLAGTGSDHRLTKWSAKACEQYVGLGKPRAKQAIDELIANSFIKHTESSTRTFPQYMLEPLSLQEDPIFLPVQIVTGFSKETPVLRRVRETGDPLLLRMLIDLYGQVQLDATHGLPLWTLRESSSETASSFKIFEVGVHAAWALVVGSGPNASGEWTAIHRVDGVSPIEMWRPFWNRVSTLKKIGAIWFEPWVFDSNSLDAEPIIPVDPSALYADNLGGLEGKLTRLCIDAVTALSADRTFLIEKNADNILVPLSTHRQAPSLKSVCRMTVEADTPGRRLSFAKRMAIIDGATKGLNDLIKDANFGLYDRPIRL